MNKAQSNKFKMFEATESLLSFNSSFVESIPEFQINFGQLKEKIEAIREKNSERNNVFQGKTIAKNTARKKATDSSLQIAGALYAYAKKTGNEELVSISNINKSFMKLLRPSDFSDRLTTLKNLAVVHSAALEAYGVTSAKLEMFDTRIDDYESSVAVKSNSEAKRKGAVSSISSLFRETDSVIDVTDKIMEGFKDEQPQFYDEYKSARIIKDLGIRHENTSKEAIQNSG